MSGARNTQAKYGAQIPTGRRPGSKTPPGAKEAEAAPATDKAPPVAKPAGKKTRAL